MKRALALFILLLGASGAIAQNFCGIALPKLSPPHRRILIVAAEASGDAHGAGLARALHNRDPNLELVGVGSQGLVSAGMKQLMDAKVFNTVGVLEIIRRWSEILAGYRKLNAVVRGAPVDLAILIDSGALNLPLAKKLRERGVPVVYYSPPQVWATRPKRIEKLKRDTDKILVTLPFERDFYHHQGVDVAFVGHHLVDKIKAKTSYRSQAEIQAAPRLVLFPGSRQSEVRAHLPLLKKVIGNLRNKYPGAEFRVPVPPTISLELVQRELAGTAARVESGLSADALQWADIAVAKSGTTTLESALTGTPTVMFYKTHPLAGFVVRRLFGYRNFFALPNLILGREATKELMFGDATAANIEAEVEKLIQDERLRNSVTQDLQRCRNCFGTGGADENAAEEVLRLLNARRPVAK